MYTFVSFKINVLITFDTTLVHPGARFNSWNFFESNCERWTTEAKAQSGGDVTHSDIYAYQDRLVSVQTRTSDILYICPLVYPSVVWGQEERKVSKLENMKWFYAIAYI
jgi:hypothetical protein